MQWNRVTADYPNFREIRLNYEPEGGERRSVILRLGEHIAPDEFAMFRAYREDVLLQKLLIKSIEADTYSPFEPQQLMEWRKIAPGHEHVLRTMYLYQKLRVLLESDFQEAVKEAFDAVQ